MLNYIRTAIATRTTTEKGASAVEYGLLVALIAAIIVASVLLLGNTLDGIFADTEACISTQTGC